MNEYKNIIIGAGAAGLFLSALLNNADTLVLEKNQYPGKKLNITGKGRCNITNACSKEDLFILLLMILIITEPLIFLIIEI